MSTLAGSVTVDAFGVRTGSGMALVLYDALVALPAFSAIPSYPGITLTAIVAAARQAADLCNVYAKIADGPQWLPTAVKTSNYTSHVWELVLCNPTAGGFTVTLPTPVGIAGCSVRVKNVTSNGNTITISTPAGTIDGAATFPAVGSFQCFEFMSDGAVWHIISSY